MVKSSSADSDKDTSLALNIITDHCLTRKRCRLVRTKNEPLLGTAEASKIRADVDATRTGGMFFRITQYGEVCTVDASVAQFARAVRTWKSGHYFYEHFVKTPGQT